MKKTGEFYHQKYQYDALKRVSPGKWKEKNGKSIENLFNEKKMECLKRVRFFNQNHNHTDINNSKWLKTSLWKLRDTSFVSMTSWGS